jgi:putative endonuclease
MSTKDITTKGHEAAARFLNHRGYDVVETDWECNAGICDIIAKEDNVLVFVDVKVRTDSSKGFPSEVTTPEVRDHFERIALEYVATHDQAEMMVRFDVVSVVVVGPDRALIKHHINAFADAA